MKKHYLFLAALIIVVFSSCSGLRIEKRHYNKGFYVDFGNDNKSSAAVGDAAAEPAEVVENTPQSVPEYSADPINRNAPPDNETPDPTISADDSHEPIIEPTETASTNADADQKDAVAKTKKDTPASGTPHDDVALILLVILAILLPPLAVFLAEGVTKWFWITLILCIFGGGVFFYPVIGGLWLIAVIIALFVVFGLI